MNTVLAAVVRCDELAPIERWFPFLTAQRQEKLARLRRDCDKKMSVGAELALLAALHTGGCRLTGELYHYGEHGKPESDVPDKYISLSHSGGLAVCALADIPVGIDIETPRTISASIARALLSPEELEVYSSTQMKNDYLLRKWTAKESYLKLTGEGIDRHSMSAFTADNGRIIKNGEAAAYFETIISAEPDRILSCCAFEPIAVRLTLFSPDDIAKLLCR